MTPRRRCIACDKRRPYSRFTGESHVCTYCTDGLLKDNTRSIEDVHATRADRNLRTRTASKGITVEQYEILAQQQQHRCAICNDVRPLVIDHDHSTTLVRGLLCGPCNTGLGMFKDDIDRLERARQYLQDANVQTEPVVRR